MSFRSKKLTDSAEGKPCAFCLQNDGTTVAAHINSVAMGKGWGIKAPDCLHARACQTCHDLYDGRRPGWSKEECVERFALAFMRTVNAWFEEQIVQVK